MFESLADWFGKNLWAVWSVLALGLACAEMLTLDLTLLMLASGAAAGALTALVLPGAVALQIIVAAVVSVLTLFVLRPTLLAKMRRAPGYRSGVQKLVGSTGIVTATLADGLAEVNVDGQIWRARALQPGSVLRLGDPVEVYEVDGVTLVVYPADRQIGG